MGAVRNLSWPTVGRAIGGLVARCLNAASCVVGTAATAAALANAVSRTVPDGAGGLKRDVGQPPELQTVPQYYCNYSGTGSFGASESAACNAAAAQFTGSPQTIYTGSQGTVTQYYSGEVRQSGGYWQMARVESCSGPCWGAPGATTTWLNMAVQVSGTTTAESCPSVTDFYGTTYHTPGADGKCPSGNYVPTTAADFGASLQQYPPSDAATVVQAFTDWLHSGYPCESCSAAAVSSVSGSPATYEGNVVASTTFNPDGSSVLEEVWPTYAFDYSIVAGIKGPGLGYATGIQMAWSTTTTTRTTTKNASGVVTGTTTKSVTIAPASAASAAAAATEEAKPKSLCATDPDASACAKLGEIPPDELPPPVATKEVEPFEPDTSFSVDAAGVCPEPEVVAGLELRYDFACDAASMIKPFVLVSAVWAALMMALAAVRQL
jgi:hypothetical protein